jgi:branched-chain amino acid transport system permease protein
MDGVIAQLPQQLINGLTLGAVYALVALGYSLVYGVLRMLNFAHGDVFMVGAFLGFGVLELLAPAIAGGMPPWLALAAMLMVAMLGCGLLGVAIEAVAYRPLREAHPIAPLLSAVGVSFFIQSAVQLSASASHRAIRSELVLPTQMALNLGDVRISAPRLLALGAALALMAGLHLLVTRSRLGRSLRAVAADREAAAMMGVDVSRAIAGAFFLSSALAGAAGVLVGLTFSRVYHLMGLAMGLKGFTAAVIGGIGSMPGSMLGGLLLGLAESLAAGLLSPTFADLIAFGLLLLVLLLRPAGLIRR